MSLPRTSEDAPKVEAVLDSWKARLHEAGLAATRDAFFSHVLDRQVISLRPADDAPRADDLGTTLSAFADDLLRAGSPCLVGARMPSEAVTLREALERSGFHLVECYLTFQHDLRDPIRPDPPAISVRTGTPRDDRALRAIASESFDFSRFHLDPRIPRALADDSRAEWVGNALAGRAERVFVVEDSGDRAGFLACTRRSRAERAVANLDLIATRRDSRGRGLGRALVAAFLAYARENFDVAEVGTQAQNHPAIRLYESMGFRIADTHYTYHRHLPGSEPA